MQRKSTKKSSGRGAAKRTPSKSSGSKSIGSRSTGSRSTGSSSSGSTRPSSSRYGSGKAGSKSAAAKAGIPRTGSATTSSQSSGTRTGAPARSSEQKRGSDKRGSDKPDSTALYRPDRRRASAEQEPSEESKKRKAPRRATNRPAPKVVPTDGPLIIKSSRPPLTELTPSDRKSLKAKAHHLNPVVQVGKHLVTEKLIAEVSQALEHHELIKVKFVEGKLERAAHAKQIAERAKAFLVAMIGNVAILYREQTNTKKRKVWF